MTAWLDVVSTGGRRRRLLPRVWGELICNTCAAEARGGGVIPQQPRAPPLRSRLNAYVAMVMRELPTISHAVIMSFIFHRVIKETCVNLQLCSYVTQHPGNSQQASLTMTERPWESQIILLQTDASTHHRCGILIPQRQDEISEPASRCPGVYTCDWKNKLQQRVPHPPSPPQG